MFSLELLASADSAKEAEVELIVDPEIAKFIHTDSAIYSAMVYNTYYSGAVDGRTKH